MINLSNEIKELEQEIERLEIDKFAYFCNDQYDICGNIDKQIKDKRQKIKALIEN